MEDTKEPLNITISVDSNGAWSSDRGGIAPGDYPRAIQALKNMIANMSEEYGGWAVQIALIEAVRDINKDLKNRKDPEN